MTNALSLLCCYQWKVGIMNPDPRYFKRWLISIAQVWNPMTIAIYWIVFQLNLTLSMKQVSNSINHSSYEPLIFNMTSISLKWCCIQVYIHQPIVCIVKECTMWIGLLTLIMYSRSTTSMERQRIASIAWRANCYEISPNDSNSWFDDANAAAILAFLETGLVHENWLDNIDKPRRKYMNTRAKFNSFRAMDAVHTGSGVRVPVSNGSLGWTTCRS